MTYPSWELLKEETVWRNITWLVRMYKWIVINVVTVSYEARAACTLSGSWHKMKSGGPASLRGISHEHRPCLLFPPHSHGYLKRLSSVPPWRTLSSSHPLKGGFFPSTSPRLPLPTLVTRPFGHLSNDIQLHASGTGRPLMTPSLRFWWAQEFDEFNRMRRHAQNRHLKLVDEARGLPSWLPPTDYTSPFPLLRNSLPLRKNLPYLATLVADSILLVSLNLPSGSFPGLSTGSYSQPSLLGRSICLLYRCLERSVWTTACIDISQGSYSTSRVPPSPGHWGVRIKSCILNRFLRNCKTSDWRSWAGNWIADCLPSILKGWV